MEFTDWIRSEMEKRGWNQSELSRRMEMDSGTLGNVLNSNRQAGVDFCIALSRALGISREEVFRARGWLLREPEQIVPAGTNPLIIRLVEQINRLPPDTQEQIARSLEGIVNLLQEKDSAIRSYLQEDTKVDLNIFPAEDRQLIGQLGSPFQRYLAARLHYGFEYYKEVMDFARAEADEKMRQRRA